MTPIWLKLFLLGILAEATFPWTVGPVFMRTFDHMGNIPAPTALAFEPWFAPALAAAPLAMLMAMLVAKEERVRKGLLWVAFVTWMAGLLSLVLAMNAFLSASARHS